MRLFPFHSFQLVVDLPLEEIIRGLKGIVAPSKPDIPLVFDNRLWGFAIGTTGFYGSVTGSRFRLIPIINYRNSFLPVYQGSFSQITPNATLVRVRGTLHPFVVVILLLWFGALGYFGCNVMLGVSNATILIPIVLFGAFAYYLCYSFFWLVADGAEGRLQSLFRSLSDDGGELKV